MRRSSRRWLPSWQNLPAPDRPRIGILGGTFDPPHVGHVAAGRAVVDALDLDRLLLVVANDPWQKSGRREISPAEDRYALTEALAGEIPGAEASRLEIDRGGASYSVDTAEEVHATLGPADLFLVVGADLVPELETWHRPTTSKPWSRWRSSPARPRRPRPSRPAGGWSGSTGPTSRSRAPRSVTCCSRAGRSTVSSPNP